MAWDEQKIRLKEKEKIEGEILCFVFFLRIQTPSVNFCSDKEIKDPRKGTLAFKDNIFFQQKETTFLIP